MNAVHQLEHTVREPASRSPKARPPREVTILLQRRRERDEATDKVNYSGYDILWPDGRPVGIGLQRFCQQGTRLLLGRARDPEAALIRLWTYPVAGLEAALTKPGPGVRCRRFYLLRHRELLRLHFFTGTPTEVVFSYRDDEPEVLHWIHAEHIQRGVPFWIDLASQMVHEVQPVTAF